MTTDDQLRRAIRDELQRDRDVTERERTLTSTMRMARGYEEASERRQAEQARKQQAKR